MRATLKFAICAMTLALASGVSSCCSTKVFLGAVIGDQNQEVKRSPGSTIWICPGEPVTLGWATSNDVSSAAINTLASVVLPAGMETVRPSQDITYKLVGHGKCDRESSVDVFVVTKGKEASFAVPLIKTPADVPGGYLYSWEVKLPNTLWSPSIFVTSVRLVDPPTLGGWDIKKTDGNGTVRQFPISNTYTSPWPVATPPQMVGTWLALPHDPNEVDSQSPPLFLTISVTMECH